MDQAWQKYGKAYPNLFLLIKSLNHLITTLMKTIKHTDSKYTQSVEFNPICPQSLSSLRSLARNKCRKIIEIYSVVFTSAQ